MDWLKDLLKKVGGVITTPVNIAKQSLAQQNIKTPQDFFKKTIIEGLQQFPSLVESAGQLYKKIPLIGEPLSKIIPAPTKWAYKGFEGFGEGYTGGLVDIPAPKSKTLPEKLAYTGGYVMGTVSGLPGKIAEIVSTPLKPITQPLVKKGLELTLEKGLKPALGRGMINVAEGIPYGVAFSGLGKVKEAMRGEKIDFAKEPKEQLKSMALDFALGSAPFGAVFLSTKPLQSAKIKSTLEKEISKATSAEEASNIVDSILKKTYTKFADLVDKSPKEAKNLLKSTRAALNKYIDEAIGHSGNWKRDYYIRQAEIYDNPENLHLAKMDEHIGKIDELLEKLKSKPAVVKPKVETPPSSTIIRGGKGEIKTIDDLASVVAKEYNLKGGEGKDIKVADLIKELSERGYVISSKMLDTLTNDKTYSGKKFSLMKEKAFGKPTGIVSLIFDEGFKPKPISAGLKKGVVLPTKKKPVVKPQVEAEPLETKPPVEAEPTVKTEALREPPLLTGEVKPLTPQQAIRIYKKTGKAYPFENILESKRKEAIPLTEKAEQLTEVKVGKASTTPAGLVKAERDLSDIDFIFSHPRRIAEDFGGEEARRYAVDFHASQMAQSFNETKRIVDDILPVLTETGAKPRNKESELLFDFIEGNITEDQLPPDKVDAFVQARDKIRSLYDYMLNRINAVRRQFGQDEIKRRENYITHIVELGNEAEKVLGKDFSSNFYNIFAKGDVPFFAYGEERKGKKEIVKDVYTALDKYIKAFVKEVYLPPSIERFRQLSALAKEHGLPKYGKYFENIATYLQKGLSEQQMAFRNVPLLKELEISVNNLASRVGKNLIRGNISAAFSNFAPIFTTLPTQVHPSSYIKGIFNSVLSPLTEKNDFMVDQVQSVFLRTRNAPPHLKEGIINKALDKLDVFRLFTYLSDRTAISVYMEEAKRQGLKSPKEIMEYADNMASKLIGERVFGLTPTYARDLPHIFKPLVMFTLEPVNFFYTLLKDNSKLSENSVVNWAVRLGVFSVLAELFNQITEKTTGRRFVFSPIDIIVKITDIILNKPYTAKEKAIEISKVFARNIPFADIYFGKGGGLLKILPIEAPIPTVAELEEDPLMALAKVGLVGVNPYGFGYQTFKTLEGLRAYGKGMVTTPKGEMKYPVEKNLENFLKLAFFGKASVKEAREFYEEKRRPMSLLQTKEYELIAKKDPEQARKFYNYQMFRRGVQGEITRVKNEIKEAALKGENIQEKIPSLLSTARHNISYYVSQYQAPKGVYQRVLEAIKKIIGLEAKEVEKEKKTTPSSFLPPAKGVNLVPPPAGVDLIPKPVEGGLIEGGGRGGGGVSISIKKMPKMKIPTLKLTPPKGIRWIKLPAPLYYTPLSPFQKGERVREAGERLLKGVSLHRVGGHRKR